MVKIVNGQILDDSDPRVKQAYETYAQQLQTYQQYAYQHPYYGSYTPTSSTPMAYPFQPSIPRKTQRPPESYNLFGLPDIIIYEIHVKPHIYLLAGLIVYLIGPQALIALVVAFFYYRWHLNKQAAQSVLHQKPFFSHNPYETHSTPIRRKSGIHSIHDYAERSST